MTEALEAELARLRAELAGVRDALAQRDRALVAAHRAIEIAQADNEKLRHALDGTTRMMAERSDNSSRGMRWMRNIVAANQEVLTTQHPGAALLAERDAARAVVAAARDYKAATDTLDGIGFAEHALFAAVADYDRAMKARET